MDAKNQERTRAAGPQAYALAVGVVYLILGLSGIFLASGGRVFGVFGAGIVLDILRTVIGLVGLLAARRGRTSRALGLALFVALAGLTVFGVLVAATGLAQDVNSVLVIRWPDNILHAVTALLGLVVGFFPAHKASSMGGHG
jgi:hypothetical protein